MNTTNHSTISVVAFKPEYATYFDRFNRSWLEEYFHVEPIDTYVLENPEEAILKKGGRILFALYNNEIIGTIALKSVEPGVFELTKMGIDKKYKGMGTGKLLCNYAIAEARTLNAHKIILYSNTVLATAINIYRSIGFTELPMEYGVYERSNIKMELSLNDSLSENELKALIESYGHAYDKISTCLKGIPESMWNWQPPHNKWTIKQNILHLADSEVNSYIRCRRFLAEPGSQVLGYDQDKWAALLHYDKQDSADALELFRLLRKMSYELIKRAPMEVWQRTVEHSENGTTKMWQWLRTYENHTHVLQMQRVYEAWKKETNRTASEL